MIMDTFLSGSDNANSALSHLVKRLQEALAKAEESDVLTALPSGGGESSRVSKQLFYADRLPHRLSSQSRNNVSPTTEDPPRGFGPGRHAKIPCQRHSIDTCNRNIPSTE